MLLNYHRDFHVSELLLQTQGPELHIIIAINRERQETISIYALPDNSQTTSGLSCSPLLVNICAYVDIIDLSAFQTILFPKRCPGMLYSVSRPVIKPVRYRPWQVAWAYAWPRSVYCLLALMAGLMSWFTKLPADAAHPCPHHLLHCNVWLHKVIQRPRYIVYPMYIPPVTHRWGRRIADMIKLYLQWPQITLIHFFTNPPCTTHAKDWSELSFMQLYVAFLWRVLQSCVAVYSCAKGQLTLLVRHCDHPTLPKRRCTGVSIWMSRPKYWVHDTKTYMPNELETLHCATNGWCCPSFCLI